MTTNIVYNTKKFETDGMRVTCTLVSTFNLDSLPELRALLVTKRVKKMLEEKHCEVTTDNNIIFTTTGEAKFNPEDDKFDENIGRHLAEDRATEKAMNKVLLIYKWLIMYTMNIKDRVWDRVITMATLVEKMHQHNEDTKHNPQ